MLKLINSLVPFFEDCYGRINVREYARAVKITPPTAAKILLKFNKEGLLKKEYFKNYHFYYANKDSKDFVDLSHIYWRMKLQNLTSSLKAELIAPTIVLFGSLAKAEVKQDSDVDLAIFSNENEFFPEKFEKELKRKIQVFFFPAIESIKSKELANNILNGFVLEGRLWIGKNVIQKELLKK